MDVVVTSESRFCKDQDGRWICADGTYGYAFWQRYLDVFDRVIVAARCASDVRSKGTPVEGPRVDIMPLSNSHGLWGAMHRWAAWRKELNPLIDPSRAFVLRLPGQIGGVLGQLLRRRGYPFGVEAVGDPAAVFGSGVYRHPLRPGLRIYFQRMMRQLCREAVATSYVTSRYLQTTYPANARAFTTHYSSVELSSSAYVSQARNYLQRPFPLQLINVATMGQRYKGQHHLIEAVEACVRAGRSVQLALVGDGRYRSVLEAQTRRAKLNDHVRFLGQLPAGAAIRQALDQADVFVLSSLTEGLPRVLLEAQARGLPCVATRVGGVPELLSAGECVPSGNPSELAATLLSLLDDPHRLTRLSQENLQRARRFASPILRQRRAVFYRQVRDSVSVVSPHRTSRAA